MYATSWQELRSLNVLRAKKEDRMKDRKSRTIWTEWTWWQNEGILGGQENEKTEIMKLFTRPVVGQEQIKEVILHSLTTQFSQFLSFILCLIYWIIVFILQSVPTTKLILYGNRIA